MEHCGVTKHSVLGCITENLPRDKIRSVFRRRVAELMSTSVVAIRRISSPTRVNITIAITVTIGRALYTPQDTVIAHQCSIIQSRKSNAVILGYFSLRPFTVRPTSVLVGCPERLAFSLDDLFDCHRHVGS